MKVRKGSGEEIPLIQGKEQWLRFAGVAQGKRNPSKTVGVARGHQRADTLKSYSQKTSQSNHTRTTALSNSMKLSHARGETQDGWVMVERFENPMNSMKRQNDRTLAGDQPRLIQGIRRRDGIGEDQDTIASIRY